jgi:hypothetical protein
MRRDEHEEDEDEEDEEDDDDDNDSESFNQEDGEKSSQYPVSTQCSSLGRHRVVSGIIPCQYNYLLWYLIFFPSLYHCHLVCISYAGSRWYGDSLVFENLEHPLAKRTMNLLKLKW